MKAFVKAIAFLLLLTFLDFFLRQGLILQLFPLPLPKNPTIFLLYSLFAGAAWFYSRRFCKREGSEFKDLGIAFDASNRTDFYIGLLVGIVLWALVSIIQAFTAGFTWELRPEISLFNILYGLLFIFVADLGTELYTRGYPLTRCKDSFGATKAILIMTIFVGLKSYRPSLESELLVYSILIPALHTIFFSIIYFKTKRLGAGVGVHTGANFVTISIFDLRSEQAGQPIPSGIFQPNTELEALSINALQLPWVIVAGAFSIAVYFWWAKEKAS